MEKLTLPSLMRRGPPQMRGKQEVVIQSPSQRPSLLRLNPHPKKSRQLKKL
jgi:hypothetical protein